MSDTKPPSENRDLQNLKLFSILHYIYAAFGVLGTFFIVGHFLVMNTVFMAPEMWENSSDNPPPDIFFIFFKFFYAIFAIFFVATTIVNFLAAYYLQNIQNRMFCVLIAAINCLNMPLGTLLGVFTIIHLNKSSVIDLYESN